MKWSKDRLAIFSRGVIALFQGVVVLACGCRTSLPQDNPSGFACTHYSDCPSGFCEDGVCCDSQCFQTCMACNLPGKVGICSPVPKFSDDPASLNYPCTSPAQCDGEGTCRGGLGQTCGFTVQCWSGFCADGVCCESACDQTCMTCNDSGSCLPTPALTDDFDCSAPHATCNGQGGCILELGQTCTNSTECVSGFCTDGVCCDVACTGTCKSCAIPGSVGTCSGLPAYANDPPACAGPDLTCDGAGECKNHIGAACSTDTQCVSGLCLNGTCQPPPPLPGPLQWLWSNDQTVCKDPNGVGFPNQYPIVDVRQIVARDDESIYGVGDYTLPSQGLPSEYGRPLPPPDQYQDNRTTKDGPHAFQLDVGSGGASASWSTVAQYFLSECFANTCMINCQGLTCLGGTGGLGPFIEPAGGDVVFFRKKFGIERQFSDMTKITCDEGELSKRAAPQWALGTNDVCAHEEIAFAGDADGNMVTREDDRLKKYDPSGAVVLDIPTPFDFGPTALGLSAMGDIHGAVHTSDAVRLARTNPSGALVWTKMFSNPSPLEASPHVDVDKDASGRTIITTNAYNTMDLAVDVFGNSIVAFYAYATMDVGNGPMPAIGAKDIVLAKFDALGNVLWAKRMGSGGFAPITVSMRKTGAEEIALMVHFTGTVDLGDGLLQSSPVLIKYDTSGNLVWRADLLPLYPPSVPEVLSVAISGHPSGAVFVAGTGYGLASSTPEPHCDLGVAPNGITYLQGTYPRPLRLFAAKYGP